MWLLSDLCNIIHVNPKDVMRLSSFGTCINYNVVQDNLIDHGEYPSDLDIKIPEEERLELNTRRPRYVSCIYKYTIPQGKDFRLPRVGDIINSIKVESDRDIFLWCSRWPDRKVKVCDVRNLSYNYLTDILMTEGPATIEVEWIVLSPNTFEYEMIRWITEKTKDKPDGYLTLLSKIRGYALIELGLNINVVEVLMYNLLI